jgi:histidyl-tRNA synthetase
VSAKLSAPRGTFDLLPEQAALRLQVEQAAREVLEPAGYGRIETPTFEATELFARGVGASSDIVQKEMYSFDDGGGRSLTLRPEGTAPVCRAYVEHGMHKLAAPVKLYYLESFFRAERPQAGRYRQFWQVGAEALGSDDPALDAEIILLLHELLTRLGASGLRLRASVAPPRVTATARNSPHTSAPTSTSSPRRSGSGSSSTRFAPSTPSTRGPAKSWRAPHDCLTASPPKTRSTSPK